MRFLRRYPWIWAAFGTVVLWVVLSVGAGQFSLGTLTGILGSAALLGIVALGQMFVITTGNGAVDLSIPSVMTLAGFVVTSLTNGQNGHLPFGVAAALAVGAVVGGTNAMIVNRLRIPPIIATLAMGYILTTVTLVLNRGFQTYAMSPLLAFVAAGRFAGVPNLLFVTLGLTLAASWILNRTAYGRWLGAVGQNAAAAFLAGVQVNATRLAAYVTSGLLAGLGGVLLSGKVGGAFLEMGNPFLLQSVGAVVVGGTSILGGKGTGAGTLLGSIFLVLVVTCMQVLRLPGGFQDVAQGLLIILVLAVATAQRLG